MNVLPPANLTKLSHVGVRAFVDEAQALFKPTRCIGATAASANIRSW